MIGDSVDDVAAEVERRIRAAAELTPAVLKEILNG